MSRLQANTFELLAHTEAANQVCITQCCSTSYTDMKEASGKTLKGSLTVVSIEFLDDDKVRELLDQLGVRENLDRLVRAPPRRRSRPAVQPVERWSIQLHAHK